MNRATILHLTDLHLGDDAPGSELGAYKDDFVGPEERERRRSLIEQTLSQIDNELRNNGDSLAAVVVSGDITFGGDPGGYELFEPLLEKLGNSRPGNSRIVVVPGNHDVISKTPPDSDERYALFREHIVEAGYVVPALAADDPLGEDAILVDEEQGFLIAPINSSNWCRVLRGVPDEETQRMLDAGEVPEPVAHSIEVLRLADPGRVARKHLSDIRTRLEELDGDGELTRIAVLHHHLLPVSTREDLRPYEGLTNLQLMRKFLGENGFRLVLHGHKHAESAYYDRIVDQAEVFPDRSNPVLVVSGSTVGAEGPRNDTCRLLSLRGGAAPEVKIERLEATDAGGALTRQEEQDFFLWNAPRPDAVRDPGPSVVHADSLSEAYARIMGIAEHTEGGASPEQPLLNLVCHIRAGADMTEPPLGYPTDFLDGRDPQEWFRETVTWWQRPGKLRTHGEGLEFSHGDRIYNYRNETDQLKSVVETLKRPGQFNGRAVISLLDPSIDGPDESGVAAHRFPAFAVGQFVKRRLPSGRVAIDATGFFRKQELRYWWPVNAAELALLQRELCERLGQNFEPGAIVTVSTIGYVEEENPPRVAIPSVDLLYEEDEARLFELAYALTTGLEPGCATEEAWEKLTEGLTPPQHMPTGGPPLALDGLHWLSDLMTNLAVASKVEEVDTVAKKLRAILALNKKYAETLVADTADAENYRTWRGDVVEQVQELRAALKGCTKT
jgi:3',5'-cyclic AMP phosphodiesterase CpdA